jgi:hypothetical protein
VGKKERIMRYVLALLAVVSTWGIIPASSQECEPEISLASLDDTYTVGSAQYRVEPDRNTAVVKEGEFEPPETIAAIERNREDRERTVLSTDSLPEVGLVFWYVRQALPVNSRTGVKARGTLQQTPAIQKFFVRHP